MSVPKNTVACDIIREEGGRRVQNTRLEWQPGRDTGDITKQRWRWGCSCGAYGRWVDPNVVPWPRVHLTRLWWRHVYAVHPELAA